MTRRPESTDAGLVEWESPSDESHWIDRLRAGDDDAYELLVRAAGGRMLAVARRFLRSEHDCADVVQESFLAAFKAIGDFQGGSKLTTWLQRIVVNACLMKLRAANRRPESSMDPLLPRFDETGHHVHGVASWSETAVDQLCKAETRQRVRDCIDQLPEPHRSVLILRDIQEIGTEEAAALLGTTTGALKVRLHRARQALRTLLEPLFTQPLV
jgi:RNA polymerase sigma-70 factor (ECF subfamily)